LRMGVWRFCTRFDPSWLELCYTGDCTKHLTASVRSRRWLFSCRHPSIDDGHTASHQTKPSNSSSKTIWSEQLDPTSPGLMRLACDNPTTFVKQTSILLSSKCASRKRLDTAGILHSRQAPHSPQSYTKPTDISKHFLKIVVQPKIAKRLKYNTKIPHIAHLKFLMRQHKPLMPKRKPIPQRQTNHTRHNRACVIHRLARDRQERRERQKSNTINPPRQPDDVDRHAPFA
jgi:hypothetical protein